MAWIIDKDHFGEGPPGHNDNAVGIMGPSPYEGDGTELKCKFRMLTDDRDLVYEGRCDTDDDENALGPLDDFGSPNFGCTIIQYWVASKGWTNLN
jgi:hypothetical protein